MRLLKVGVPLVLGSVLTFAGYVGNLAWIFFAGWLLAALALGPVAWVVGYRDWPQNALRVCLFASLYLLAVLALEGAWRAFEALRTPGELRPYYTYEQAKDDPAGFRRWWQERMQRWLRVSPGFTTADPLGKNPYVLAPGSVFTRQGSEIQINGLGFRGREIERDKGNLFRIVALGESTTFGLTLIPEDRTWPELLEESIRSEYDCASPIQVVNAGVPGWTLANQIMRLPHDVQPLEPDVLLTYHGYNGFSFFFPGLMKLHAGKIPTSTDRPSVILGSLERVLRLWWFQQGVRGSEEIARAASLVQPLNNHYARQYELLAKLGKTQGSQVVLASFNMAVDSDSPEDVVRFYEKTVPDVRARIIANKIHNRVVEAVARKHGLLSIDTSTELDGAYRNAYIDIAHFTQLGRQRLARNLLDGLRPLLVKAPNPGCRLRSEGEERD